MSSEKWIVIPDYPDYKISTEGRVFSIKSNKELKQFVKNSGYKIAMLYKNGKGKTFTIHRLVADTFFDEDITNKEIDHIDGVKNNNSFQNLRVCSHQQNNFNRGKTKNNTSGFKSVNWEKSRSKWGAYIRINGKTKNLGRFDDKEEAYGKYKEAAKYYHGDYLYQYL